MRLDGFILAIMYNLAEQQQKDVFICSAIVWDCRGQSPTKKSLTLNKLEQKRTIKNKTMFIDVLVPNCI